MQRSRLEQVRKGRRALWIPLVAISLFLALIISACQSGAEPEAVAPTAVEPAATEPAPTEEPASEPTATAEPEEEATATPQPEEEATATPQPEEEAAVPDELANGRYIVNLTGGCGCHFNSELGGLAGGNRFAGPFGVVYAANITPDQETGIGSWSVEEIASALQTGARPDGSQLYPIMPYHDFSLLSDRESLNVAAYLLSLAPIANDVPEREVTSDPAPFTPVNDPPAEPATDPVARGEVLVTIARCGMCHTPRNADGSVNMDLFLAGATVQDETSANITPHESTSIGQWSEDEIAHFLVTGMYPGGGRVTGSMAQQIDRRFSNLTEADALAIAAYLKSIPPINHDPYAQ
ncbi:MAG: c-type cytochrome [Caldilineaceae bacterium]|nr:c-type cytochrome [Caldilineaceae bacterium]